MKHWNLKRYGYPTYNKYGNKKETIDGITFDSKHEASIYAELKLLERCGAIRNLQLQVPFIILDAYEINGRKIRAVKYVADFVFINEKGEQEVWDAKGVKTDVYKLKKKMFEQRYKIEIKEV